MRTLKLAGLLVTATLALASCGGGGNSTASVPKPATNTTTTDTNTGDDDNNMATTTPVAGGTIARPADATAANEFVISGERATAMAQSLGLKPQALDADLRVLLAVTRSTTGNNAGKKRAVATFVWGNGSEQVTARSADSSSPAVTLDVYPQATPAALQTYKGALNLKVESPNFQDKTTKSSPYIADSGLTCAKLVVDLKSLPNSANTKNPAPAGYTPYMYSTAAAPLEVCEGQNEKDAESAAINKAVANLNYTYQSAAAAPFTFQHFDGEVDSPSADHLLQLVNLPAGTAVTTQGVTDFFGPLEALPAGDSSTWTTAQKAAAATARKYTTLRKQLTAYYQNVTVYHVAATNGREDIYILGKNGFGVGGVKTSRFIP